MAGKGKIGHLHGVFVDGRRHQAVDETRQKLPRGGFKGKNRVMPTQLTRLTQGDVDVLLPTVDDIDFIRMQLLRTALLLYPTFSPYDVFVLVHDLGIYVNHRDA